MTLEDVPSRTCQGIKHELIRGREGRRRGGGAVCVRVCVLKGGSYSRCAWGRFWKLKLSLLLVRMMYVFGGGVDDVCVCVCVH